MLALSQGRQRRPGAYGGAPWSAGLDGTRLPRAWLAAAQMARRSRFDANTCQTHALVFQEGDIQTVARLSLMRTTTEAAPLGVRCCLLASNAKRCRSVMLRRPAECSGDCCCWRAGDGVDSSLGVLVGATRCGCCCRRRLAELSSTCRCCCRCRSGCSSSSSCCWRTNSPLPVCRIDS
jgi:hypothetical protein